MDSQEQKNGIQASVIGFMILSLLAGTALGAGAMVRRNMSQHNMNMQNISGHREDFISARDSIMGTMMANGDYACCLEKPCTYCIEKTPGHGEGASCHCLDDIMNGKHPCGECIGEIMEGHGNKFLSKYFAQAIAEEVGISHLDSLKEIIEEKYDILSEDQI